MRKCLLICLFWNGFGINSLQQYDENDIKYKFEYSVEDYKSGNSHSREEERRDNVLKGSYSLQDPDGYRRTVNYKVDGSSGFVADVKREKIAVCSGCGDPSSQFQVGYQIRTHTPDSSISSYFFMGSGLYPSSFDQQTLYTN